MALETWLTRTLGIEVPIFGAPMGGRAGGALVGEVSKAGGLGLLGAARYATPEWVAKETAVARSIGGDAFGIGLMTWALDDDDALLDAALAENPPIVSLSFGDPAPYVERVHATGALVVSQVNTIDDLRVVEAAGVDFVIAQGGEAGGHTGRIGTLPLLQEILDATALPGRLIAAGSADTVYTSVFDQARSQPWPARWGGRALSNAFTSRWHGVHASDTELATAYDPANPDLGVVYAGEAAGLVTSERPAGVVVRQIAADAERLLHRFAE